MKIFIEPISETDLERVCIIDPPYTVLGSSVLLPSFNISMNIKGLREMLAIANDEDSFSIIVHHEKMTEYSIVRKKTEGEILHRKPSRL